MDKARNWATSGQDMSKIHSVHSQPNKGRQCFGVGLVDVETLIWNVRVKSSGKRYFKDVKAVPMSKPFDPFPAFAVGVVF
jgi:hypothetical protein